MFQLRCRQKSTNTSKYSRILHLFLSLSSSRVRLTVLIRYHLIQLSKWTTRHFHRNKAKWFTTMLTTYYTINAATILIFEPNLIYKYMHACVYVRSKRQLIKKVCMTKYAGFTFVQTKTIHTHLHILAHSQEWQGKAKVKQNRTEPNNMMSVDNSYVFSSARSFFHTNWYICNFIITPSQC